ncbi:unnamed protein product [Lactuca virosa]|uniref:Uncharacterized protein n=1 Tax=Lactuca virosa TaxID=75947 RepID=A0AAU9NTN9_9ASTR|nr:unnamed protein product [Lactuca virosa]
MAGERRSLLKKLLIQQESPNKPWERSRLWCHEESLKVLLQKKGTGNVLGLILDIKMLKNKKLREAFELKTDTLKAKEINWIVLKRQSVAWIIEDS